MSDIPIERKLQLVSQLRSQYHKNRYDMANREQILYGRSSLSPEERLQEYDASYDTYDFERENVSHSSSFKLRLVLAVFLLGGIILLDKNGIKIAGTDMQQVFRAISVDYYSELEKVIH